MSFQTTAMLNGQYFPYSPNSVSWNYILNKVSFNTVGGRVTQVLSIKIGTISWEGDTGSRQALLDLYTSFKNTQDMQIENEESSQLIMPTPIGSGLSIANLDLNVWARSMQIGWDYQSVTYPYRIQFEVDQGFGDVTNSLSSKEIDRLTKNIGWSNGPNAVGSSTSDYSGLTNGLISVNTSVQNALDQFNSATPGYSSPAKNKKTNTNTNTTAGPNNNATQQSAHSQRRT